MTEIQEKSTLVRVSEGSSYRESTVSVKKPEKTDKTANISRRHHWFPPPPPQMTSEKRAQKFHTDKTIDYLDLGSDASLVWNFCARFLDVIWGGNQWWRREMSAVFQGYESNVCQYMYKLMAIQSNLH